MRSSSLLRVTAVWRKPKRATDEPELVNGHRSRCVEAPPCDALLRGCSAVCCCRAAFVRGGSKKSRDSATLWARACLTPRLGASRSDRQEGSADLRWQPHPDHSAIIRLPGPGYVYWMLGRSDGEWVR